MENKNKKSGIVGVLIGIIICLITGMILFATGIIKLSGSEKCDKNNEIKEESKKEENVIYTQKSTVSTADILSYYKSTISIYDDSTYYSVIDINGDKIPELLISINGYVGNSIIADTSVWTYDENKGSKDGSYIIRIGTITGRNAYYKMNDGRLLAVYGHMGFEYVSYYKIENDWLIRSDFYSKETEEYLQGDVLIEFKPCTDTSLIDNYQ